MLKILPVILLLCSTAAIAATVYKTVDENGVVSFSDIPPAGQEDAEILEIRPPVQHSPEEYLANLEAMRESTDRLAADRREREKHRAELKEIKAKTAAYETPVQPTYSGYRDYYPVYSRYSGRRSHTPWRPGYQPKPEHPIARPPMRPAHDMGGSSNKQLMRPLVSTRR